MLWRTKVKVKTNSQLHIPTSFLLPASHIHKCHLSSLVIQTQNLSSPTLLSLSPLRSSLLPTNQESVTKLATVFRYLLLPLFSRPQASSLDYCTHLLNVLIDAILSSSWQYAYICYFFSTLFTTGFKYLPCSLIIFITSYFLAFETA